MKKTVYRIVLTMMLVFLFQATASARTIWVEMVCDTNRDGSEYALISAYEDSAHRKEIWCVNTGNFEPAELSRLSWIGAADGHVYYVEDGDVVALDAETGNEVWRNRDFMGSPCKDAIQISSSGKIYLSGYYGPDLFVVDKDGTTKSRVDSLKLGSYWPYKSQFTTGNYMKLYYESDNSSVEFDVTKYFGTIERSY